MSEPEYPTRQGLWSRGSREDAAGESNPWRSYSDKLGKRAFSKLAAAGEGDGK